MDRLKLPEDELFALVRQVDLFGDSFNAERRSLLLPALLAARLTELRRAIQRDPGRASDDQLAEACIVVAQEQQGSLDSLRCAAAGHPLEDGAKGAGKGSHAAAAATVDSTQGAAENSIQADAGEADDEVGAMRVVDANDRVQAATRSRKLISWQIPVVSTRDLGARRSSALVNSRQGRVEREMEAAALEALIDRGQRRAVTLPSDWPARLATLREDMLLYAGVIDSVAERCGMAERTGRPLRIAPMLLVGLPALGKSYFASRLADALGVPQHTHMLTSAETVSQLCGSDKHWSNAQPGMLWRLIVEGEIANPVVIIDEIDKAKDGGSGYQPVDELLAVLEPKTASRLVDKAMDISFDASFCIYVATANRLSPIKSPLLSRFEVFHIPEPDARARVGMVRAILRSMLGDTGLDLRVGSGVVQQLAMTCDARRIRRVLDRAAARAVAAERDTIGLDDLSERSKVPRGRARVWH